MNADQTALQAFFEGVFLVLGGGTVGAFITAFFNRKKVSAEVQGTLSEATMKFATVLGEDIEKLRTRLERNEERHELTKSELEKARSQLEEAQEKSEKLQEIVHLLQERDAKNTELIQKLTEALKKFDPSNPLIQALATPQ